MLNYDLEVSQKYRVGNKILLLEQVDYDVVHMTARYVFTNEQSLPDPIGYHVPRRASPRPRPILNPFEMSQILPTDLSGFENYVHWVDENTEPPKETTANPDEWENILKEE